LLLNDISSALRPASDQEFPDMTILMESSMPDRTVEIKYGKTIAAQRINRLIMELIDSGCNPIAIPCITAHSLVEPRWFDSAVLDFRDCIVRDSVNRGSLRTGILATDGAIHSDVFSPLADQFDLIFPSEPMQEQLMSIVYGEHRLKSYSIDAQACRGGLDEIITNLRNKGADCIIAGCTEIEMFLTIQKVAGDYLLPMDSMSKEVLRLLQEGDDNEG